MNTNKIVSILTLAVASITLSACNYSNTFTGTYNSAPTTLTAYSKNINKYCISLNFVSANFTQNLFIGASQVFDRDNLLQAKTFNSKGTDCSANASVYMAGTRSVTVLGTAQRGREEGAGYRFCRMVYYNEYHYQENLDFDVRDNTTDQVVGKFVGTGVPDYYTDYDAPVTYGPIYYCGPPPGYPGGYPRPIPRPMPRPVPRPGSPHPWHFHP